MAESFERIHRSNLVGMGVLPLQFKDGVTRKTLGLTGEEIFDIGGFAGGIKPRHGGGRRPCSGPTARRRASPSSAGSIRWTRSNTSATAASCPMCCAICAQQAA